MRWRRKTFGEVSVVALMLLGLPGWGQAPHREALVGAERLVGVPGLGLGRADVARARGVEALLVNPAGLGAMRFSEFSLATTYRTAEQTVQFRGVSFPASHSRVRFGQLGLVLQTDWGEGFGVGLAFH